MPAVIATALVVAVGAPTRGVTAQEREACAHHSLDLTVGGTGISIGNSRRVNGLRLNFRDCGLEEVNGVNITIWTPYEPATGVVNGVALGLPVTGAGRITGVAAGVFGVGATESIKGIGLAPIGLGAGQSLEGIMIGGIGAGAGTDVRGLGVGLVGLGAGRDLWGLNIGGIGLGAGRDLTGIALGGIGLGAGADARCICLGGIGVGAGGRFTGLGIGLVGIGVGGDATGIMIGGVGVGSGGTLKGLAVSGVGTGAPKIVGIVLSAFAAGSQDVRGAILAPGYVRVEDGRLSGASLSAFNHIKGEQHGLTIGIVNYARRLDGVQIGVLNYAGNNRRAKLLPIANVHIE